MSRSKRGGDRLEHEGEFAPKDNEDDSGSSMVGHCQKRLSFVCWRPQSDFASYFENAGQRRLAKSV